MGPKAHSHSPSLPAGRPWRRPTPLILQVCAQPVPGSRSEKGPSNGGPFVPGHLIYARKRYHPCRTPARDARKTTSRQGPRSVRWGVGDGKRLVATARLPRAAYLRAQCVLLSACLIVRVVLADERSATPHSPAGPACPWHRHRGGDREQIELNDHNSAPIALTSRRNARPPPIFTARSRNVPRIICSDVISEYLSYRRNASLNSAELSAAPAATRNELNACSLALQLERERTSVNHSLVAAAGVQRG